jgi:hypothetical protein
MSIDNIIDSINNNKSTDQSSLQATGQLPQDVENVMAFAFVLLVEAVDIQSQSSVLKAKGLASNGNAQQRLNSMAAALQFYGVPELKKAYQDIRHTHWHWEFWHNGFHYSTIQKITIHLNDNEIQSAQTKNQQQNKMREGIENQLTLLQQNAQVGESQVNSQINQSAQTTQEAVALTSMLQSLTEKILTKRKG